MHRKKQVDKGERKQSLKEDMSEQGEEKNRIQQYD